MDIVRHNHLSAGPLALAIAGALAALGLGFLAVPGRARGTQTATGSRSQRAEAWSAFVLRGSSAGGRHRGLPRALVVGREPSQGRSIASAVLKECVTASAQHERSVTFMGQMATLPGATQMLMRIDLEERLPGEPVFHRVSVAGNAGLGAWRTAESGVKIFKDVKQVSDLSAGADYRALVRYRWIDAQGNLLWRARRRTPVCHEPASEAQLGAESPPAGSAGRNSESQPVAGSAGRNSESQPVAGSAVRNSESQPVTGSAVRNSESQPVAGFAGRNQN